MAAMQYTQLEKKIDDTPKHVICECIHCGERSGAGVGKCPLTCKNCRTEEGRNKICTENQNIFSLAGLVWHCKHCGI